MQKEFCASIHSNRFAVFIIACLLLVVYTISCRQHQIERVTFDKLFSNPISYNNQQISIEGFFFQGFEVNVLSERLEYSGFAPGHLVPKGRMLWISGEIPEEVYKELDQQQMMGPTERYGKLNITGLFESFGKYGHLSGYNNQIVISGAQLLSWSQNALQK